jgi:hypothetical protein
MKRYKKYSESKEIYRDKLLHSSYFDKFNALIRLQEKALFFNRVKYKFSETFQMPEIIDILNDLENNDIVEDYVIGGATALLYYSTPHLTDDIDVFIKKKQKGLLFSLSDLYEFLKRKYKAVEEGEFLIIKGNPLQFLVPGDKITQEAFDNPNIVNVKGKKFKIFSLEYIIGIMLYLGKSKYKERLRIVKEENQYNDKELNTILKKYNLLDKWGRVGD